MIHASTETLPNPIRCQGGKEDYYSSPEDEETAGGDTFLEVTVAEPLKVGEGISSFLMFRVTTKTNLPFFKSDNFGVNRRFSDFLGVHEKLSEKYLPRGRVIPPAPEKSIIGATKVKMTSAATSGGGGNPSSSSSAPASAAMSYSNNFAASSSASHQDEGSQPSAADQNQAEFIARRRFALERFINRVGQHPVLRRDPIFVEFLESNRDLPRATSTSAISSASVFRLLGKVGDTVNKITYKMEENDPWYEEKILQIDSLENQFKKLYGLIENLVQCRHDLALATGSFAHGTAMLSNTEEAHSLSRALAYLAKVEEKVQEVHHNQAEADYFYLFELVKDYVALIGAVKEVLAERSKAFQVSDVQKNMIRGLSFKKRMFINFFYFSTHFQTWQHAQSMVIKKKEQRARLEMGGKSDKIPAANEEVMEWETRLEESQENFNQISETIKGEIDFFERYRVKDFKFAILQYLEALMNCQLQMVKHWEEFLPEVKSILF